MGRYGRHSLQDFDSPWLKTKKHWNSFTTGFFLELSKVQQNLRAAGKLHIDVGEMKTLLKKELRCNKCSLAQKTMPQLKVHIATCTVQEPGRSNRQ